VSHSRLGGIGGLTFGILGFVGLLVGNAPGGNYTAADVSSFLAKGHRPAVFVSAYLVLLSAAGLLLLLSRLRGSLDGAGPRSSLFWGFSVAAATAWMAGYAIVIGPAVALAFSGGKLTSSALSGPTVYTFVESGFGVMYGAGGFFLACALIAFTVGRVRVPAWVRWATGIAAVTSLAGIAWFPFFLVYLWAVALGVWALAKDRSAAAQPLGQPV